MDSSAPRAFDDGSLQLLEYGLDASGVHRAGDQLLKQVLGQDRFRRSRRRGLLARHGGLLNLVIVGPSHKNPDTLEAAFERLISLTSRDRKRLIKMGDKTEALRT